MLGSKSSISGPNIVLNTIVAEELSQFADVLEKAGDFNAALNDLIRTTIREHKRIIFNGNNYSDEWVAEAERRGLLNLKSTVTRCPTIFPRKTRRCSPSIKSIPQQKFIPVMRFCWKTTAKPSVSRP